MQGQTPPIKKIEGFFNHLEHEAERQEIFRSSALFYAKEANDFHTEFLLFNYWRLRRGLENLTLRLTLRDMSGAMAYQNSAPLDFKNARTLRLHEVLTKAGLPADSFEGSLEFEILSPTNLVIPYPAICVRYYGENWHTMTHSYSRHYTRSSGDSQERIESYQETVEGNWTVFEDPRLESIFVVHNGLQAVPNHDLRITVSNYSGKRHSFQVPSVSYTPFETRVFCLSDYFDPTAFLAGQPGAIEVSTLVSGVYPRMLSGARRKGTAEITVDHSNFNYVGEKGLQDQYPTDKKPRPTLKSLGYVVPAINENDWRCFIDVYPTYPADAYRLQLKSLDADGRERASLDSSIGSADGKPGAKPFLRLDVSELLKPTGPHGALDIVVDHDKAVPSRFHMGVHYKMGDGLPAFLIDGPMPYSAQGKTSRWMPVISSDKTETHVLLSNQIFDSSAPVDCSYEAHLYNSDSNTAPLSTRFSVPRGSSRICKITDLFPEAKEYLKNEAGWVYFKSDKPAYSVVNYAITHGQCSLAVDHAF